MNAPFARQSRQPLGVVRIPEWLQGPPGRGQGGWTAAKLAAFAGGPVTVRLVAGTPLDVDLHVVRTIDGVDLVDPRSDPPKLVMRATPRTEVFGKIAPVDVATAREARSRFIYRDGGHPVPHCFSCGEQPGSMCVHAGVLPDGRAATDWRPPDWAVGPGGAVDAGVVWAAMDCASGWYVSADGEQPLSFTAQYAVETLRPVLPGRDYAIVAGPGDFPPRWEGRKRQSLAGLFDDDGALYARAVAFWVAVSAYPATGQ